MTAVNPPQTNYYHKYDFPDCIRTALTEIGEVLLPVLAPIVLEYLDPPVLYDNTRLAVYGKLVTLGPLVYDMVDGSSIQLRPSMGCGNTECNCCPVSILVSSSSSKFTAFECTIFNVKRCICFSNGLWTLDIDPHLWRIRETKDTRMRETKDFAPRVANDFPISRLGNAMIIGRSFLRKRTAQTLPNQAYFPRSANGYARSYRIRQFGPRGPADSVIHVHPYSVDLFCQLLHHPVHGDPHRFTIMELTPDHVIRMQHYTRGRYDLDKILGKEWVYDLKLWDEIIW